MRPKVAATQVQLSGGGGPGSVLASVATDAKDTAALVASMKGTSGKSATLAPASDTPAAGPKVAVKWAGRLPAPSLAGDTAVYADVSPGVDVKVTALARGFESFVVLKKRPAPGASFSLPVDVSDAALSQDADGSFAVKDGKGKVIGRSPAARMWDSAVDPRSGEPAHSAVVKTSLKKTAGGQVLTVTPSQEFLDDPNVTYPVVVDPVTTIGITYDTDVEKSTPTTTYLTADNLRVGSYDGSEIARSFLYFPADAFIGSTVTSASLNIYQYWAITPCSPRPVEVHRLTSTMGLGTPTWNAQPGISPAVEASVTESHGNGCPEAWLGGSAGVPVTAYAQDIANGALNYGLALKAGNEADAGSWKRFRSMNYSNPAQRPYLSVTFRHNPATPGAPAVSPLSAGLTDTKTPTLSTVVASPDGVPVRGDFTIFNGSTAVWSGNSAMVASGSTASVTVPAGVLSKSAAYTVKAVADDGTVQSVASASSGFTVDVTPPGTPTIAASAYTNGQWTPVVAGANTFTFTTSAADAATFRITRDSGTVETKTATSGSATLSWEPSGGFHTVTVSAVDKAGNAVASPASFSFGVGGAGVIAPSAGLRTAKWLPITASAPAGAMGAALSWRPTGTTAWNPVVGEVKAGGVGWSGSVQSVGVASKLPDALSWNVSDEHGHAPAPDVFAPAALDVQACFTYPSGPAQCAGSSAQFVSHAFGGNFATTAAGPGTVALSTGEVSLSATDADVPSSGGDLSVSRTWLSFDGDTSTPGVFGPGWSAQIPSPDAGVLDAKIVDKTSTGQLALLAPDGSTDFFSRSGGGTGPGTYVGTGETAASATTVTVTASQLSVKEPDGTTTVFTGTTGSWSPGWVVTAAARGKTASVTATATGTTPTSVTAVGGVYRTAAGAAGDCADTVATAATLKGCRLLTLSIAPSTTTNVTTGVGDFKGRATKISTTMWNPATSAMTTVDVAAYSYNPDGTLARVWNPRMTGTAGPLYSSYTYINPPGGHRQLTSAGPPAATVSGAPALAPSTIGYDGVGRVATVSRRDPNQGAPTTTNIVYDVPVTGSGLPDVSVGAVTSWGQPASGAPVAGTAVFDTDPGHAWAGSPASPAASDWPYAAITYVNAGGRTTNTASYGAGDWQIDSTAYDTNGNPTWALSAANRALARAGTCTAAVAVCAQTSTAARANLLASTTVYDPADPSIVTDTYGPAVDVQPDPASPAMVTIRRHSATVYNEGKPASLSDPNLKLPTTVTTTGTVIGGTGGELAPQVTTTGYNPIDGASVTGGTSGWVLRQPTTVTTDPGGAAITRKTRYDSSGNTVEDRQPKSGGSDAGTRISRYYTADDSSGVSTCNGSPQWAGLTCQTTAAAAPSSGGSALTSTGTYSRDLAPAGGTDTAGSVSRSVAVTFDTAGRPVTTTTTGGAPGDAAVPATTVTYDPATGAATSVNAGGKTITTVFDKLGRPVSYTDADGVTSTTSYDIAGRVVSTNDGKATTTLSYDGANERRGVVTAVDTGLAGMPSTFSTTYDARGVATTTAPGGVVKTVAVDASGFTTSTGYKTAAGVSIGSWTQTADVAGRVATQAAPIVAGTRTRAFTYDGGARLTGVKEQATGQCTARGYGFDKNSNRTTRTSYTPVPGACPATPGTALTTTTGVFDTADRLTTSATTTTAVGGASGSGSYTYDSFGRATTVPSVDAGGTTMTQTFFTDDKIATQTQAGTTRSWTRDPVGRQSSWADTVNAVTGVRRVNHYDSGSDSPSWTDEGNGTATRAVTGPDGDLAIIATHTTTGVTARLQIGDPQGTIITTIAVKTNAGLADLGAQTDVDEYGQTTTGATPRYGWHGTDQRSSDGLGGTMLMGVRMYQPATGRFLTTDPVYGGNDNTYIHPTDPVNKEDLTGRFWMERCYGHRWGTCWDVHFSKGELKAIAIGAGGGLAAICEVMSFGGCSVVIGVVGMWAGDIGARHIRRGARFSVKLAWRWGIPAWYVRGVYWERRR